MKRRALEVPPVRRAARWAGASRALGVACAVALIAACAPTLPWTQDMVETQVHHPDEGLRLPPEGSLHREGEIDVSRFAAAMSLSSPLEPSDELLERGAELFRIYCEPCHGAGGRGDGRVADYFGRPPLDLTSARARSQTDGYVYATIKDGGGSMPGLGARLDVEERWAIVLFIRSLQR